MRTMQFVEEGNFDILDFYLDAASKTYLAAIGMGIVGFFSQIDWLGLIAILVSVLGLLIQAIALIRKERRESRKEKREMEAHAAKMKKYKD